MDFDTINEVRSFVPDYDQLFFEQVCRSWRCNNLHSHNIPTIVTPCRSESQILEIFPYLNDCIGEKVVKELAFHGKLSTLVALDNLYGVSTSVVCAMDYAARGGHLNIIRWLQSKGVNLGASACNGAAWGGHLDLIITFEKEGVEGRDVLFWCIIGGQLETLKKLQGRGYDMIQSMCDCACEMAAEKGYVDMLKYLIEELGYFCDTSSFIQAAIYGHMDTMKYLIENKHTPSLLDDLDIIGAAVQYGQFEATKYLLEDGFPVNEFVMHQASLGGNLNIVKYLHEYGCPWDSSVYSGNLEIMEYAYEEGCPFTEYVCDFVAQRGDMKALEFLREHGCPWWSNAVTEAYDANEFETVLYLREHGCPWPENIPLLFCN